MLSSNELHMCAPGELSLCFQTLLAFMMLERGMSMFVVSNGDTDVALMSLLLTLEVLYVALELGILVM